MLVLLAAALAGCHHKAPAVYEPQLSVAALAASLPTPDNAYELLVSPQTEGRFPCSLAIAKLALSPPELSNCLGVVPMTPAEQAYWTETFRGFTPVRDLRFLGPVHLKTDGNDIRGLLVAAERIGSPLLMVHVLNRYGPNSAQVLGILYDVESSGPIATLQASARYLDEDGREVALEKERGDHRERDATYQASRRFEQLALACLREQARRDLVPTRPQPHRWIPLYPYHWQVIPRPVSPDPMERQPPATQPAENPARGSGTAPQL